MTTLLDYLQTRRSVTAKALAAPGPDKAQLETILSIASRVPDHKKLAPFRFVVFEGDARDQFGTVLSQAYAAQNTHLDKTEKSYQAVLEHEQNRFNRVPVVVAVIASPIEHASVPEWEQTLTAGAVCMNMLHAIHALGFSGQWLSEWYAYNSQVHSALGLAKHENIAGFMYMGTKTATPKERARPDTTALTQYWHAKN